MFSKIVIIVLGITLLVMFIFMEKRLNAIFKGRSRRFYIGMSAVGLAALVMLYTVDFIYILMGLGVILGLIAIAPWLVDRFYRR